MIFGVAGLVDGDCRSITADVLKRAAGLGFKTVQMRVDDPTSITPAHVTRLKSLYRDYDFEMPQTVGNYGGGLISQDEKVRARSIKFVKRMINLSARLGSPNTYLRPGSLNPGGAWLPHPENWSDETFDRLIDSSKQICKVAESEGVKMAVEGGVVCPVSTPQRVKDLIDGVGSKALGFNMDPVNFIGSLEDAYFNQDLLDEFYSLLGSNIIGAHAKDFKVVESLLPHIEEAIIGSEGAMLDQETFLRGMERVCPKGHVLIEHLPDEDIPAAKEGLKKVAEETQIRWN